MKAKSAKRSSLCRYLLYPIASMSQSTRLGGGVLSTLDTHQASSTSTNFRSSFTALKAPSSSIGKTFLLVCILINRLFSSQTTCLQLSSEKFSLWCTDGVFILLLSAMRCSSLFLDREYVWYLIDSSTTPFWMPLDPICGSPTLVRIIQAVTP
ncbi:hypothetical protein WG66_013564 [Moniliophthora roreri]|nr:hypothetical protein WG66_013564 [Moniliophthora roreri]